MDHCPPARWVQPNGHVIRPGGFIKINMNETTDRLHQVWAGAYPGGATES